MILGSALENIRCLRKTLFSYAGPRVYSHTWQLQQPQTQGEANLKETLPDPNYLATLKPSARNKIIGQIAHKSPQLALQASLTLKPGDYGCFLLHSKDLGSIIPALTNPYPTTRVLATKAFRRAWAKLPPAKTLRALGGAGGLADILDSLSYNNAMTIASYLGRSYFGPSDQRTITLEALMKSLVPNLSKDGPTHSVSRLGPALVSRFIPALSPPLIDQLLCFVQKGDRSSFSQIIYNHPAYVADLLLTKSSKFDNPNIQFDKRALKWLFAQRSIGHSSINDNKHWGIHLLVKVISRPEPDEIVFNPSLDDLFRYITVALRSTRNKEEYFKVIESILTRVETEQAAGKGIPFHQIHQITLSLAHKLAQAVKENSDDNVSLVSAYLQRLGGLISGGQLSFTLNPGVQACLQDVAPSVRLRFLRLLYSVPDDQEWSFPEDWPRISAPLLTLLAQKEGEPILRRMDASLEKPGPTPTFKFVAAERVNTIINLLKDEPQACRDAVNIALRGYWAFSQNDVTLQEKTRMDLKRWKELAHRQTESEGRQKYLDALLTMAAMTGNSLIMKDLLSWAYQRFLKDRDVRYEVLEPTIDLYSDILAGDSRNIEETTAHGDEVLSLFINMQSKLRSEPDFEAYKFDTVFTAIRTTLMQRLEVCQRKNIPVETTETIVSPLRSLFLHAEQIQLDDPVTFGKFPSYPRMYLEKRYGYTIGEDKPTRLYFNSRSEYCVPISTLNLSRDYRRILVRFMDQLGQARHKVYASNDHLREDMAIEPYKNANAHRENRSAWPYEVFGGYLQELPWEQDAPFLTQYIRKIVFTPVDSPQGKEDDVHKNQLYKALDLLVTATPGDRKSQAGALLPVIQHYRTKAVDHNGRKVDLSALLLQSMQFKDAVHRNEELFEAFYRPYLTDNQVQGQSFGTSNLNLFFGLPRIFKSGDAQGLQDSHFNLLRRRQGIKEYTTLYEHLLPQRRRVRCSQNLHRHLTLISATGWIHGLQLNRKVLTSLIASSDSNNSGNLGNSNLITLYQNSLRPYNIKRWPSYKEFEIPTLISGIDLLSLEEIGELERIIEASKAKGSGQTHRDIALKELGMRILLHSQCPMLLEEEIFKFLMDMDKSTSHRSFFNIRWLRSLPRDESRRLIRRFANLVSDDATSDEAAVKVTTIKHLIDIITYPATGLSLQEMLSELTRLAKNNKHSSVQHALLSSMIDLLAKRSHGDPPAQIKILWDNISRLALVSSSLNEERLLEEEDWSHDELPTIAFDNSRPSLLMRIPITSFPLSTRSLWANLIDKMLGEQVISTRRWILGFMQKNGATATEIKTVEGLECGPLLNSMSWDLGQSYTSLRKYLPQDSWHLRILKSQLTSSLFEHRIQSFFSRISQVDVDWKSKQSGRDFLELLSLCSFKYDEAFRTLLSTLQDHGAVECRDALMAGLQVYLQPQYMLVKIDDPTSKSAPWQFLSSLVWKLKPADIIPTRGREGWKFHIQPVVLWLQDRIHHTCLQEGENPALYMKLMIDIDSVALPFPILEPEQTDRHEVFANQLFELVTQIHQQPLGFLHLWPYFEDHVARMRPLVGNAFAVANSLVEIAEKQTDPAKRLLGYRLFLSFAQSVMITPTIDREKKGHILALGENLAKHKDQNVQALILDHPDCFASSLEQEQEAESSDSGSEYDSDYSYDD